MSRKSPYTIVLSSIERLKLEEIARCLTLPYFWVLRAKLVLLAAMGLSNSEIAHRLSVGRDVVSQWRRRFYFQRLAGLHDLPRSGRPRLTRTDAPGAQQKVRGQRRDDFPH